MPHQCTTCGRAFPDGSKEMLSGCPDCGGNKFQFKPAGATTDEQPTSTEQPPSTEQPTSTEQPPSTEQPTSTEQPPSTEQPTSTEQSTSTEQPTPTGQVDASADADPAPTADRQSSANEHSGDTPASDDQPPEPADAADPTTGTEHVRERSEEDVAQASARSDVVSPDELDRASQPVSSDSDPNADDAAAPDGPRPDINELRDELNEQFESIRIVSPGKYELNLMELYDRQEYIISLQEDGRYIIEMPDAWGIQDE
ncbi:OapC/ArvC family zinc-ribbon domain-containing protein [Halorubrum sp. HHNYT27]|uniref:Zn-ribbon domain-containing protein n=1 Tax=Halorubrum sp. HHNYT27 TaxID=3402275 RepID=UPI003EBEF844